MLNVYFAIYSLLRLFLEEFLLKETFVPLNEWLTLTDLKGPIELLETYSIYKYS